jgi:hypothetical protein
VVTPRLLLLFAALTLSASGCGRSSSVQTADAATPATAPHQSAAAAPDESARAPIRCGIAMRHVALHVADGVVLDVTSLDGELVSQKAGQPPVFDDPGSYVLRMRTADATMNAASLTTLVRQRTAAGGDDRLRDLQLAIEEGALKISGKLHKGVWVPFTLSADVAASGDGRIRLHARKLKTAGVPVKGLLDLFGVDVGKLMKMPAGSGISADGDDLLLDTTTLMPPPRMEGRVERVAIAGDRMALTMTGDGRPPAPPAKRPLPSARNYIYFFGGSVRFGKLTMSDADMQLIDADARNPFDFFPAKYEAQLVAGYSRNTPQKGLQVFMPDYAAVSKGGGRLKPPTTGTREQGSGTGRD